MRLLLDTHSLIWTQESPARIGPKAMKLLANSENELLISAVSTLEIARLMSIGRIKLTRDLLDWLDQAIERLQGRSCPMDHRITREAYHLPGEFHRDPADRLLVATARLENAKLVTADDLILAYPHVQTVDVRK